MSPQLPKTFSHWRVNPSQGFDGLELVKDAPLTDPKRGQVVVKVRAVSLNFRDLAIAKGLYPGQIFPDLIPTSDGACEVVAVGEDVTKWAVGDRVIATFAPDYLAGEFDATYFSSLLGGQAHGMLSQYRILEDYNLVRIASHLSYEEAATLPCAALTAWNALFGYDKAIRPGQTVLSQGTGGVSVFGAQFALHAGARVIMTSSSDDKLETVRSHLVDQAGEKAVRLRFHTINYKTNPDWAAEALKITGDVGVDRILEVGGAGTIEASFKAIRQSGVIAAIGILTNGEHKEELPNVGALAPYKTTRLQGITIGSRRQLEDMCDALEHGELRPLITKTYAFEDAKEAFQHQWDGGIIGKVVIRVA